MLRVPQERNRTPAHPENIDLSALLRDTDRCVKCALCLPTCPTYAIERTETQSPRGRVALVQGVTSAGIAPADAADALDSCLACGACEKVCPAQVPFGSILDRGRALVAGAVPRPVDRWIAALLRSPLALRLLAALHRLSRFLPLPPRLARLRAMAGERQSAPASFQGDGTRGEVVLLEGCVTDAFDRAANASLDALLGACGYRVRRAAGCCGGLSQHGGDLPTARQVSGKLLRRLQRDDSPIVHAASGCAAAIRDVGMLHDTDAARAASSRVVDPFELLARSNINDLLQPDATNETTVALHLPCTQRNVRGGGDALSAILSSLPGVDVVAGGGHGCCGAAGTHMLTHPDAAATLGRAVIDSLGDLQSVDVLVSANIGCAWHLRATLRDRGSTLEVLHPATFLARRLVRQSNAK
jgi:glycolate oxidase iron-sulfur subunit